MIWLAVYVFTVLSVSAGILGHAPLLPRAARWVAARRANRASRGSRATEDPPKPAHGRTAVRRPPSWSKP